MQGREDGLVRITSALVVLADECDDDWPRLLCLVYLVCKLVPVGERPQGAVPRSCGDGRHVQLVQAQHAVQYAYEVLAGEDIWHPEKIADVVAADNPPLLHVAPIGELLLRLLLHWLLAPAQEYVWLKAQRKQRLDRVLRGLGFLSAHVGDIRAMAPRHRIFGKVELELADGLDERHGFYVADRAAELDHADLRAEGGAVAWLLCHRVQPIDDRASDVGHDLNRLSQVVSATLLTDDMIVHLPRGQVVPSVQRQEHHALVVAQVQVCLPTVVENVHLSVLVRAHQARVYVDVRVQLDRGDSEPVPAQERADGGGGDALAQGAAHATRDHHVLHALVHRRVERRRRWRRRRGKPAAKELVELVQRWRRARREAALRRDLRREDTGRLRGWLAGLRRPQARAAGPRHQLPLASRCRSAICSLHVRGHGEASRAEPRS
mmetsp:Transcript_129504/g.351502  ORF Transcript_129504/g.351502 Transcript_129504/m.351502 type:complete len:435 (-) Transcript_129504:15-1319(-)